MGLPSRIMLWFIFRKGALRVVGVVALMTVVQNVWELIAFFVGVLVFALRRRPFCRLRREERRSHIIEYREAIEQEEAKLSLPGRQL